MIAPNSLSFVYLWMYLFVLILHFSVYKILVDICFFLSTFYVITAFYSTLYSFWWKTGFNLTEFASYTISCFLLALFSNFLLIWLIEILYNFMSECESFCLYPAWEHWAYWMRQIVFFFFISHFFSNSCFEIYIFSLLLVLYLCVHWYIKFPTFLWGSVSISCSFLSLYFQTSYFYSSISQLTYSFFWQFMSTVSPL